MRRQLVIGVLKDTARMLELAGESFYRVRAYNNAVMALLKLDADFEELVQQDRLREIPALVQVLSSQSGRSWIRAQQQSTSNLPRKYLPPSWICITSPD